MTSQLAQISMVEGIQGLNTTLTTLLSSYNTLASVCRRPGPSARPCWSRASPGADQRSGTGAATLGSSATSVIVTIKDSTGKTVQTQELGPGRRHRRLRGVGRQERQRNASARRQLQLLGRGERRRRKVSTTPIQLGTVSAVVRSGTSFGLSFPRAKRSLSMTYCNSCNFGRQQWHSNKG